MDGIFNGMPNDAQIRVLERSFSIDMPGVRAELVRHTDYGQYPDYILVTGPGAYRRRLADREGIAIWRRQAKTAERRAKSRRLARNLRKLR